MINAKLLQEPLPCLPLFLVTVWTLDHSGGLEQASALVSHDSDSSQSAVSKAGVTEADRRHERLGTRHDVTAPV